MNVLKSIAVLGATAALITACGGGGSTGSAPPPVDNGSGSRTGTLAIFFSYGGVTVTAQGKSRAPAARTRRPQFITPGIQSLAIYDGTTLIYVANLSLAASQQFATVYANGAYTVSPGTCTNNPTSEVCTLSIRTTVGSHTIDLISYPAAQTAPANGGVPKFTGVISSEGEVVANVSSSVNSTASLTMLGVASNALLSGPDEAVYNSPVQFSYDVWDSTPLQILQPGAYDNGPVTISAVPSGVVTVSQPASFASPPPSPGPQSFTVTCTNPNGGSVSVVLQAGSHPNATYASGLAYSDANYSSGTLDSAQLSCDGQPAIAPITVQSHRLSPR
ncbi:MAG TPA: hypothetical protein VHS78_10560 [Candidatus Elarobacter sp.]|jgi:hypothetical protein|nr:hypothetical protein [Candidatus Elarobacter sp.]